MIEQLSTFAQFNFQPCCTFRSVSWRLHTLATGKTYYKFPAVVTGLLLFKLLIKEVAADSRKPQIHRVLYTAKQRWHTQLVVLISRATHPGQEPASYSKSHFEKFLANRSDAHERTRDLTLPFTLT